MSSHIFNFKSELHAIVGCMKAGKTTKLICKLYDYMYFKSSKGEQPCVLYKNKSKDTRLGKDGKNFIARTKITFPNTQWISDETEIDYNKYNIIGIDEIHFYDADKLFSVIKKILSLRNKIVIFTTLNGDYRRKQLPIMNLLWPYTTNVIYKTATCYKCGDTAYFSTAIINLNGEQVIKSDDGDIFQPACQKCYISYD